MTDYIILENTFRVRNKGKTKYRSFMQSKRGLYYTYMRNRGSFLTLETMKENKSNYSDQDCTRVFLARKLRETMGNISTKDLLYTIDKRLIPKFPITHDDLNAANDIFGI